MGRSLQGGRCGSVIMIRSLGVSRCMPVAVSRPWSLWGRLLGAVVVDRLLCHLWVGRCGSVVLAVGQSPEGRSFAVFGRLVVRKTYSGYGTLTRD